MKFSTLPLFALVLALAAPAWAQAHECPCAKAAAPAPGSADAKFDAIYTAEWKWRQEQFPGGDDEAAGSVMPDHLPRVDAAAQGARLKYWDDVLKQLDAIPVDKLSSANLINFEVYKPQIADLAADVRFRQYEMPFNSDSQFWSDLGFMSGRHLRNAKDAENYIALLNDVPCRVKFSPAAMYPSPPTS
jgi:uncharacterized protein (DUF885 family)